MIYHYNSHCCEYMCLNIAHPSETPYLSLTHNFHTSVMTAIPFKNCYYLSYEYSISIFSNSPVTITPPQKT